MRIKSIYLTHVNCDISLDVLITVSSYVHSNKVTHRAEYVRKYSCKANFTGDYCC